MRNVVPRQGTEIIITLSNEREVIKIEKCSSPTGDGNADWMIVWRRQRCIEKCSSPTGDGN